MVFDRRRVGQVDPHQDADVVDHVVLLVATTSFV
jgi:hypothetical protein